VRIDTDQWLNSQFSSEKRNAETRYNSSVRRKSKIDLEKRRERIERARGMTPEERLLACVNFSSLVVEFQRAGKRYREEKLRLSRS